MKLSKETLALLEDIERRIDPETEDDFVQQWRDFLWNRFDGEIFNPERKKLSAPCLLMARNLSLAKVLPNSIRRVIVKF